MNTCTSLRIVSLLPQDRLVRTRRKCFAKGWLLAALAAAHFAAAAHAGVLQMDALVVGAGEVFQANGNSATTGDGMDNSLIAQSGLVLDTNTISIAPTGIFDVKDNAVIVRLTPFATVYSYLVTGYNGGLWTGFGINSSTAANDSQHGTGVGIINNAEAHYTTFEGHALAPAAESLVKYAFYGDSNLDGQIDSADFALFGTGTGWYHGDFNYDGVVNGADVALLNAGYHELYPGSPLPDVPEPGTLALALVGGMGLIRRWRVG